MDRSFLEHESGISVQKKSPHFGSLAIVKAFVFSVKLTDSSPLLSTHTLGIPTHTWAVLQEFRQVQQGWEEDFYPLGAVWEAGKVSALDRVMGLVTLCKSLCI